MSTLTGPVMQGYGAMSLTDFMKPEIAPNAEATLRHVLESGVTVINTAGLLSLVLQQDLCPLRYCSSAWPTTKPAGTSIMRLFPSLFWVQCRILRTWDL